MLHTLNLPAMAATISDVALKAAKANLTHAAFLDELVQQEGAQRDERRISRLRQQSGLPLDKTFQTLRLARFPLAIRQQIEQLRRGTFVDEAINVVAAGQPGVGKSPLLAALGHDLILQGHPMLWTSTVSLVQRLLAAKRDLRLPQLLAQLDPFRLPHPRCHRLRPARSRRNGGVLYVARGALRTAQCRNHDESGFLRLDADLHRPDDNARRDRSGRPPFGDSRLDDNGKLSGKGGDRPMQCTPTSNNAHDQQGLDHSITRLIRRVSQRQF
jgi:hypothetical protein